MPVKVYTYKNCGTCKKAVKWLDEHGVDYKNVPIRETPPTKAELNKALNRFDGNLRKLFNTSGGDYKELGLKDKLPSMSKDEALALLTGNGNLVKRPFLLVDGYATVGFNEDEWRDLLL